MPRFAANLSYLFTELPFLDRFEAAAHAGFKGVEYHFPYAFHVDEIRTRLDAFGLTAVLHNIAPGDSAKGEFGMACLPERESDFRVAVEQAIHYAIALSTARINCLAGVPPAGADVRTCESTLIANLRHAARECARANITLTVEPLNHFDVPGFFLASSAHTIEILDQVNEPNALLQYDLYHMHLMGDDLAATLTRVMPRIGHIQFADAPGRNEPGTGVIDFARLFPLIDALGYAEWVGAEYRPSGVTTASFSWLSLVERGLTHCAE